MLRRCLVVSISSIVLCGALLALFEAFRSHAPGDARDVELWVARGALVNSALLFANLLVVWLYVDLTGQAVGIARSQALQAEAYYRFLRTPVLVVAVAPDGHAMVRNVGSGPACQVVLATAADGRDECELLPGLASGAELPLPGHLDSRVRRASALVLLSQDAAPDHVWFATEAVRGASSAWNHSPTGQDRCETVDSAIEAAKRRLASRNA